MGVPTGGWVNILVGFACIVGLAGIALASSV